MCEDPRQSRFPPFLFWYWFPITATLFLKHPPRTNNMAESKQYAEKINAGWNWLVTGGSSLAATTCARQPSWALGTDPVCFPPFFHAKIANPCFRSNLFPFFPVFLPFAPLTLCLSDSLSLSLSFLFFFSFSSSICLPLFRLLRFFLHSPATGGSKEEKCCSRCY